MLIDCQGLKSSGTEGNDVLVEIAWAVIEQGVPQNLLTFQSVVRPIDLLTRRDLRRITQLCGINPRELAEGIGESEVALKFRTTIEQFTPECLVIHFAAFERPFLERLWRWHGDDGSLPLPVICTRDLARQLLPCLGAYSLKAVAGYFGTPTASLKRAGSHVEATRVIWEGLDGLSHTPAVGQRSRPGEELRSQRLGLPDTPGTYRFFDAAGRLLYVGKATSLKDRVNSYFRGGVRQDPRKREMMAQVKRLEVVPSPTPLHAALDEFKAIVLHAPPYNVMMKREDGPLFWLDRMTLEAIAISNPPIERAMGPFTSADAFLDLRLLASQGPSELLFAWPVPPDVLASGVALALDVLGLTPEQGKIARSWLRAGVLAARGKVPWQFFGDIEDPEHSSHSEASTGEIDVCLDPERVKRSVLRKVKRAAERWFHALSVRKMAGVELVLHGRDSLGETPMAANRLNLPAAVSSRHTWQELAIARAELKSDARWGSSGDGQDLREIKLPGGKSLKRDQKSLTSRILLGAGNLDPL